MKKIMIPLIILILLTSLVFAADLGDWPDMFIDGGKFDALIVVGNKASSSDVLLQIELLSFYGGLVTEPIIGAASLASDITDLKQNLILIGSPCANDIIADVLDVDEANCHKFIEDGTAIIKVIDEGSYVHLLVSGNSDDGTKEAVEVLKNHKKHDLKGNEFILGVEESEIIKKEEGKVVVVEEEAEEEILEVDPLEELKKKIEENKAKEEVVEEPEPIQEEIKEEIIIEEEPKPVIVEEKQESFFTRFINWFKSLF